MKTLTAHIEDGQLVLDQPLPEKAYGRVMILFPDDSDTERSTWLKASETRLMEVWDNRQDDIYNELLNV